MAFQGPLEDRVAIHELVASYGDAVSRQDLTDWAALWAEDSVWDHPELGRMEGRPAIVAACGAAMKQYPQLVFTGALGALTVRDRYGSGRHYTSELVTNLAGATYRVTGRYDDDYIKQDGCWLFKTRLFNLLHSG